MTASEQAKSSEQASKYAAYMRAVDAICVAQERILDELRKERERLIAVLDKNYAHDDNKRNDDVHAVVLIEVEKMIDNAALVIDAVRTAREFAAMFAGGA